MNESTYQKAQNLLASHQGEFAFVENPKGVYPNQEIYPLAPAISSPDRIQAFLMDMDGTTTTTEELCIYALETMIRKLGAGDAWEGFSEEVDYPNIIGNSTTKHVEYLLSTYGEWLDVVSAQKNLEQAIDETLKQGKDKARVVEAKEMSKHLAQYPFGEKDYLRAGIIIYYSIYHSILERLAAGKSNEVKKEIFGLKASEHTLIRPMEGVDVFIPLIKGWLKDEMEAVAPQLVKKWIINSSLEIDSEEACVKRLIHLARYFGQFPAQLALVTSSIEYEAKIVLKAIYYDLQERLESSVWSPSLQSFLATQYEELNSIYNAFVTANDSNEIRLKPHRDLYSIALYKLGVKETEFNEVVGLEDSESGTVAIRAAGVGCSVALPFAQTRNHDFKVASLVLQGGIPELLLTSSVMNDIVS